MGLFLLQIKARWDLPMYRTHRINSILKSEKGRKMLSHISPVYDEAYSTLWLLQAMGIEFDEIEKWTDEIWKLIVPQTAPEWGLAYWEEEYAIPINPEISVKERRDKIVATIKTKAPMNPFKISEIATNAAGVQCRVEEYIDDHTFAIYVSAINGTSIDEEKIKYEIKKAKPAHLIFVIRYEQGTESNIYPTFTARYAKAVTLRQVN